MKTFSRLLAFVLLAGSLHAQADTITVTEVRREQIFATIPDALSVNVGEIMDAYRPMQDGTGRMYIDSLYVKGSGKGTTGKKTVELAPMWFGGAKYIKPGDILIRTAQFLDARSEQLSGLREAGTETEPQPTQQASQPGSPREPGFMLLYFGGLLIEASQTQSGASFSLGLDAIASNTYALRLKANFGKWADPAMPGNPSFSLLGGLAGHIGPHLYFLLLGGVNALVWNRYGFQFETGIGLTPIPYKRKPIALEVVAIIGQVPGSSGVIHGGYGVNLLLTP